MIRIHKVLADIEGKVTKILDCTMAMVDDSKQVVHFLPKLQLKATRGNHVFRRAAKFADLRRPHSLSPSTTTSSSMFPSESQDTRRPRAKIGSGSSKHGRTLDHLQQFRT